LRFDEFVGYFEGEKFWYRDYFEWHNKKINKNQLILTIIKFSRIFWFFNVNDYPYLKVSLIFYRFYTLIPNYKNLSLI
jgi:hypothetical protein